MQHVGSGGDTHTVFEEVFGDVLVHADGTGCFLRVGPGHLTRDTDGAGAADPPSQERDSSLGEGGVWGPQLHLPGAQTGLEESPEDHALGFGQPVHVDDAEGFSGLLPLGCLMATREDAVRGLQVRGGHPFGQDLGRSGRA